MAFRAVLDKMAVAATSAETVHSSNIFSCYLLAAKGLARLFQPFVQADSSCPSSGRSNMSPDRPEVMKLH
jgi:hypothetical protein